MRTAKSRNLIIRDQTKSIDASLRYGFPAGGQTQNRYLVHK